MIVVTTYGRNGSFACTSVHHNDYPPYSRRNELEAALIALAPAECVVVPPLSLATTMLLQASTFWLDGQANDFWKSSLGIKMMYELVAT
jgi:hypothetical protein